MSYMSEWICSEEELREAVKEDRDRIREEIKQAIENGVITSKPLRMASSK